MGRKYVIELEEVPFENDESDKLYRVVGFNSLVFDENGIKKLKPLEEELKLRNCLAENLEVGDEVEVDNKVRFIVTHIDLEKKSINGIDWSGITFYYILDRNNSYRICKTGRKFPRLVSEIRSLEGLMSLNV